MVTSSSFIGASDIVANSSTVIGLKILVDFLSIIILFLGRLFSYGTMFLPLIRLCCDLSTLVIIILLIRLNLFFADCLYF